jgi:hypothetical protein
MSRSQVDHVASRKESATRDSRSKEALEPLEPAGLTGRRIGRYASGPLARGSHDPIRKNLM